MELPVNHFKRKALAAVARSGPVPLGTWIMSASAFVAEAMGQAEAVKQSIEYGYSYVAVASDLGMLMARAAEMPARMRPAAAPKA